MITVTALSAYEYCKRKLFLQKVLKLYEPSKAPMVLGTIRHDTYEDMGKAEEAIVTEIKTPESFEQIKQRYLSVYTEFLRKHVSTHYQELKDFGIPEQEAFDGALPSIELEAELRASHVKKFMDRTNMVGEELWGNLTPKLGSEIAVESRALHLKGRIDRVELFEDKMIPVELKTGKAPQDGVWPGHRIQIAAYIMLLKDRGHAVPEGKIRYLDIDTMHSIKLNIFLENEVKDLIKKVHELILSSTIPDRVDSENKCVSCGLKEKCMNDSFMQSRLRWALSIQNRQYASS